jgi:hypothetical protein
MRVVVLLFATLAVSLGSAACGTGRPLAPDRLYTPPIASWAKVTCTGVNLSSEPLLMSVDLMDPQGNEVPTITPAPNIGCNGLVPGRHTCVIEKDLSDLATFLYCRVSVPHGKGNVVRGFLNSDGRIGEAR